MNKLALFFDDDIKMLSLDSQSNAVRIGKPFPKRPRGRPSVVQGNFFRYQNKTEASSVTVLEDLANGKSTFKGSLNQIKSRLLV